MQKRNYRSFYEATIEELLPSNIHDMHAHVQSPEISTEHAEQPGDIVREEDVALSIQKLLHTYSLLFPNKSVTPVISPVPDDIRRIGSANLYTKHCAKTYNLPQLLLSDPSWTEDEFETTLVEGGFFGAAVYSGLAPSYVPPSETRIFDLLPPHQLDVLNARHMIVLVPLPRPSGISDAVHMGELVEMERRWPNLQIIIPYLGSPGSDVSQMSDNIASLAQETERIRFDFASVCSEETIEAFLRVFGPERLLFGSDFNAKPSQANMPHSSKKNDSQTELTNGQQQLYAFFNAAERAQLSRADIQKVFADNAAYLIESVKEYVTHKQLQMLVPDEGLHKDVTSELPASYEVRTYRESDQDAYIRLMINAGFQDWGKDTLEGIKRKALPDGIFFVVHSTTGELAATAAALHNPEQRHPFGGEVGWVATDPAHRSQRLGCYACVKAIERLRDAGYQHIYLKTDDYRLAAIKTYLNLGLVPYLTEPDMEERWRDVCSQLGLDFDDLHCIVLPCPGFVY